MSKFTAPISVIYPPNNFQIFEEWFAENYKGCKTEREPIPVFFTSYWVNNNYAQDLRAKQELQEFIDSLDRSKKWFTYPIQYDDGAIIDFKDLDVLQFNMSKQNGVMLPLICMPHPYKFKSLKKWWASFVGSMTHPIRRYVENLKNVDGFYISFDNHSIENYCRILHESIFALAPRGYGAASFRCAEGIQYGSIPVIITDELIQPFDADYNDFAVIIKGDEAQHIEQILQAIEPEEIIWKQNNLQRIYNKYYSYEGAMKQIIKYLENEN